MNIDIHRTIPLSSDDKMLAKALVEHQYRIQQLARSNLRLMHMVEVLLHKIEDLEAAQKNADPDHRFQQTFRALTGAHEEKPAPVMPTGESIETEELDNELIHQAVQVSRSFLPGCTISISSE